MSKKSDQKVNTSSVAEKKIVTENKPVSAEKI